jgi:hypothetical protein
VQVAVVAAEAGPALSIATGAHARSPASAHSAVRIRARGCSRQPRRELSEAVKVDLRVVVLRVTSMVALLHGADRRPSTRVPPN